MQKKRNVVALFLISGFLVSFIERLATGEIDPVGPGEWATIAIAIVLLLQWLSLDSAEHNYEVGFGLRTLTVGLAIIGLPYYFFRSRGWCAGLVAIVETGAVVAGYEAASWFGETLAGILRP